jgi:hypothetical protein
MEAKTWQFAPESAILFYRRQDDFPVCGMDEEYKE